MNFPCGKSIRCEGSDFPITNFSSEAPDQEIFIGVNYGWDYNIPQLGGIWATPGCVSWCISNESQESADICAARQQILCLTGSNPDIDPNLDGSSNPNLPASPPPSGPTLYYNTLQQCRQFCPDGSFTVGTVLPGQVLGRSQVLADQTAQSLACKKARNQKICISSFDGFSCADQFNLLTELQHQLSAVSSSAITGWSLSGGSLPPGWTLSTEGLLRGFPDAAGTYDFTVSATNSAGGTSSHDMTMTVLGFITPFDLPDATVGTAYSKQLVSGGGGIDFEITAGALPDGLTMDDNGLISGTPTTAGTDTTFTVSVSDAFGHTCSQEFIMDVISVGCGASTDWTFSTVGPGTCRLQISGYVEGTIEACGAALDTNPPSNPWDGKLSAYSGPPSVFSSSPFNGQTVQYVSNHTQHGYINVTLGYNAGLNTWFLSMMGENFFALWRGTLVGTSPLGTYTRDGTVQCGNNNGAVITITAY